MDDDKVATTQYIMSADTAHLVMLDCTFTNLEFHLNDILRTHEDRGIHSHTVYGSHGSGLMAYCLLVEPNDWILLALGTTKFELQLSALEVINAYPVSSHCALAAKTLSEWFGLAESETRLQLLSISSYKATPEEIQLLADCIAGKHGPSQSKFCVISLWRLALSQNDLQVLGKALQHPACCKTLSSFQIQIPPAGSWPPDIFSIFVDCISCSSNNISDLGLRWEDHDSLDTCLAILCTALESGKLHTLRLYSCLTTDESAAMLARALASQKSNVKILEIIDSDATKLLSGLKNNKVSKIQCLRYIQIDRNYRSFTSFIDFLLWDECPLLCLQLLLLSLPYAAFYSDEEVSEEEKKKLERDEEVYQEEEKKLEREILNALERNVTLLRLYYPWRHLSAEGPLRARSFLDRNRAYRDAGFSFSRRKIVRLFLLGDGEAGKMSFLMLCT